MNGLLIGIVIGAVMAGTVVSLLMALRGQGRDSSLDQSPGGQGGLWRLRIGTSEMEWSDQFYEMLGASRAAIAPSWENFNELLHREDRDRHQAAVDEAIKNGLPFQIEVRFVSPTSNVVWAETRGTPDASGGDAPIFLSATVRDITELKAAIAERDELREKLESAPSPLSTPSTTETPQTAPNIAHPVVHEIIHDLNNFLTGLLGWAQLVERQQGVSDNMRRYAEGIRNNSRQAFEQIKKLRAAIESPAETPAVSRKLEQHSASTAASGDATSGIGKTRVLFVDDQPLAVDLFVDMAKELGFGCIGYTDPEAALTELQDRPDDFDILVCDLHMPTLPGQELIEQALIIKPSVVVVVSSGMRGDEGLHEGGAQPHLVLPKPYSLDTLRETLESAIQLKNGA